MCVACGKKYRSSQVQPKQALTQKSVKPTVGAKYKAVSKERVSLARPFLTQPKWRVHRINSIAKQGV